MSNTSVTETQRATATYTPSPTAVQDVYDLIVSWVGPDADKGTAAVAMSCHKDLNQMRRVLRMAVLARFPYADEQHEPVPGKDFNAPVTDADLARLAEGLGRL